MDKLRVLKNVPYLEVITGPMFSGKSQEIVRRLTYIRYYNKSISITSEDKYRYIVLRPVTDNRDVSIREIKYESIITPPNTIMSEFICETGTHTAYARPINLSEYDLIILDEAQFYTKDVIKEVKKLLDMNKQVIVSGLDKDYRGEPFSVFMSWALCVADDVSKFTALCSNCGAPSTMAKLICTDPNGTPIDSNIVIEDETHKFVPVCRKCMHELS